MDVIEQEYYLKSFKFSSSVAPRVLQWVLENGAEFPQNPAQTYFDYVDMVLKIRESKMTKKPKKKSSTEDKFNSEQKESLKNNQDCKTFDVTLLYKLIPWVCKDLEFSEDALKDVNQLQYWIRKAKNDRNELAHSTDETASVVFGDDTFIKTYRNTLKKIVEISSTKYDSIDDIEKIRMIDYIDAQANDILNAPLVNTSTEAYWLKASSNILKFNYKRNLIWFNPYHLYYNNVQVSDCFVDMKITNSSKKEFTSKDLLGFFKHKMHPDEPSPLILIKGTPGSGKSFLIQYLISKWVNDEFNDAFPELNNYSIVLYFQCRNQVTTSLREYFREHLPVLFNSNSFNSKQFINLIKLKNTLVLVDGLDEINKISMPLINEIYQEFSSNDILFTSRPEGLQLLKSINVKSKNLVTLELNGINEKDWLSFIQKYMNNSLLQKQTKDSDILMKSLKHMPYDVKKLVNIPLNLFFIVILFTNSKTNEFKFELPYDLINEIFEMNISELCERLKKKSDLVLAMDIEDIELSIEDITKKLEKISFNCLIRNQLIVDDESIKDLRKCCRESFEKEVSANEILGCFLCYKMPDVPGKRTIFSFFHRSLQEYLSAKYLVHEAIRKKCQIKDIFEKETEFVEDVPHLGDFKWYSLVLMLFTAMSTNKNRDRILDENSKDLVKIFCRSDDADDLDDEVRLVMKFSKFSVSKDIADFMPKDVWIIGDEDEAIFLSKLTPYTLPKNLIVIRYHSEYKERCKFLQSSEVNNCCVKLSDSFVQVLSKEYHYLSNDKTATVDHSISSPTLYFTDELLKTVIESRLGFNFNL